MDTLAKVKLLTDFKPLPQSAAYAFLNECYLPGLDSQATKRNIFIYPLTNTDYKARFELEKKALEIKYSDDSTNMFVRPVIWTPVIKFNKNFKWDSTRFKNTKVISDTVFFNTAEHYRHRETVAIRAWRKKFGYGYMCISYPLFNEHSQRLVIQEWVENASTCGTGRDNTLWFKRVGNNWVSLNR